jgi:hypothetical protein
MTTTTAIDPATGQAMTTEQALNLAILSLNSFTDLEATSDADLAALDAGTEAALEVLAQLRDRSRALRNLTRTQAGTEHVFLVALHTDGTFNSREDAELAVRLALPRPADFHSSGIAEWWIAEDDRHDGSDNDSAVFVHPGVQEAAHRALRARQLTAECNDPARDSDPSRFEQVKAQPETTRCRECGAVILTTTVECGRCGELAPAPFQPQILDGFETRPSADPAKVDLQLVHSPCGQTVCDVQADDTVATLVASALDHARSCPSNTRQV